MISTGVSALAISGRSSYLIEGQADPALARGTIEGSIMNHIDAKREVIFTLNHNPCIIHQRLGSETGGGEGIAKGCFVE